MLEVSMRMTVAPGFIFVLFLGIPGGHLLSEPVSSQEATDLLDPAVLMQPQDGTLYSGPVPPQPFSWSPGSYDRFRLEFCSDPSFVRRVFLAPAALKLLTEFVPSLNQWRRIQELGGCGQPI